MTRAIEVLLNQTRAHGHLPEMPRIRDATASVRCMRCGAWGAVEATPDGEVLPERARGSVLTDACPRSGGG
jgi:hypothetical protein